LYWRLLFLSVTLIGVAPVLADDLSFKYIHDEYKKGNYDTVSRLSRKFLKSSDLNKDPRFLFLYAATESDWLALKGIMLSTPNPSWKESPFYWNAIYLFMERALVLGEYDHLITFGKLFQKEGKSSARYLDACFLFAYGLYEMKNFPEAKKQIEVIEKQNIPSKLQLQIVALKQEMNQSVGE